MSSGFEYCECTVDYGSDIDDPIKGEPTKRDYLGGGIWQCPTCKEKDDCSEVTYKVRLKFWLDESELVVDVIEPFDQRLMKPVQKEYPDRLDKDAMEEDLNEYETYCPQITAHKLGMFDCEILWNWYRSSHEYAEYDLEMFIITEEEVS